VPGNNTDALSTRLLPPCICGRLFIQQQARLAVTVAGTRACARLRGADALIAGTTAKRRCTRTELPRRGAAKTRYCRVNYDGVPIRRLLLSLTLVLTRHCAAHSAHVARTFRGDWRFFATLAQHFPWFKRRRRLRARVDRSSPFCHAFCLPPSSRHSCPRRLCILPATTTVTPYSQYPGP